jgi:hypothetical protein
MPDPLFQDTLSSYRGLIKFTGWQFSNGSGVFQRNQAAPGHRYKCDSYIKM